MTTPPDVARILGRRPCGEFDYRREVVARTRGLDIAERIRLYDIDTYLPPLLLRQDKMSMAASVESRVPMLANDVAAHALSIPATQLARGEDGKLPLRRIADDLLPRETVHRPKIGFTTPTSEWIKGDLLSLLTSNSCAASYIDGRVIDSLVAEHRRGLADRGELLWTILAFEVWLRECASADVIRRDIEPAAATR